MDRNTLNQYEDKGLRCPFVASKKGEVEVAQSGAQLKKEIAQMATVIFETIGAVGDIKVDRFEIFGEKNGLVMELSDNQLVGSFFAKDDKSDTKELQILLNEIQNQPLATPETIEPEKVKPEKPIEEKPVEKEIPTIQEEVVEKVEKKAEEKIKKPIEPPSEEKPKTKLEPAILDTLKDTMKSYLGDFTERIFKNQMKAQRINTEEFYDDDARRLVFALGKAAGMIIGPSKGRNMTNKLLDLLK